MMARGAGVVVAQDVGVRPVAGVSSSYSYWEALSLFNAVFGIGVSIGIPFIQSKVTVAGSIGTKDKVVEALPNYTQRRLAGNQNFINQSGTLTIGTAEGAGLFVIGRQGGSTRDRPASRPPLTSIRPAETRPGWHMVQP